MDGGRKFVVAIVFLQSGWAEGMGFCRKGPGRGLKSQDIVEADERQTDSKCPTNSKTAKLNACAALSVNTRTRNTLHQTLLQNMLCKKSTCPVITCTHTRKQSSQALPTNCAVQVFNGW